MGSEAQWGRTDATDNRCCTLGVMILASHSIEIWEDVGAMADASTMMIDNGMR